MKQICNTVKILDFLPQQSNEGVAYWTDSAAKHQPESSAASSNFRAKSIRALWRSKLVGFIGCFRLDSGAENCSYYLYGHRKRRAVGCCFYANRKGGRNEQHQHGKRALTFPIYKKQRFTHSSP
ncbi:hypothetical protein M9H77_11755 [Catharanthus roseus]|uniref:Uncharacterized protein n=1 Tax=Catharanthus roseus TaxID=4058 RepID=A0ACC0BFH6_CATRO|nr:hypothetical protein M9H77_11755 [Catharanthus roseus]